MNAANDKQVPRHIAIIMDGNGRWAKKRFLPRVMGHHAGVKSVHKMVNYCVDNHIDVLTLFAFSSENWRRPKEEVSLLMDLFISTMKKQIDKLHGHNVQVRFIGDRTAFSKKLQETIAQSEQRTQNNTGLTLVIAANYGGRWDICQAVKVIASQVAAGDLKIEQIDESAINQHLSITDLPEPDLFIRTGGEKRISNFLLWQLAYTELYYTQTLWPDFNIKSLEEAILDFSTRQRRFGHTGDQIINKNLSE